MTRNKINLICLFAIITLVYSCRNNEAAISKNKLHDHITYNHGGIVRADTTEKSIYLTFTGGDYNDGGEFISGVLEEKGIAANFFFTGDYYRNEENRKLIMKLNMDKHYLGPHSDKHLLYASWEDKDSLLVTKTEFVSDLNNNYAIMKDFGITQNDAPYFMPPYEWYNDSISIWSEELGVTLVNFTPGTRSNADYTTPDMGARYVSSNTIYENIIGFEKRSSNGLKGFILLLHIGTHPERKDKFYYQLPSLLDTLKGRGYKFVLFPELLMDK